MFKIYTLDTNETITFAAHELRKYLRMMMPECGAIHIEYKPDAKDGFRLGLMQQLGLDVSDVQDAELDDILYIDTDCEGGVIAGDNPRSVLLAVYEFFRQNGCRWLMPGPDGEYIPLENIKPVKYRFAPSCRYRGWGTATAHEQTQMLEYIDFTPKLGMNMALIEFVIPLQYWNDYYKHTRNQDNRAPEPVTADNVLQWKRQLEAEINLRGLQFHDVGHGFILDAFGITAEDAPAGSERVRDMKIPEGNYKYTALLGEQGGKRGICRGSGWYTQFCMSNPEARKLFAESVVRYARKHQNVDFLHVWLADGSFNHCECDECKKMKPADWYLMTMNEIDEMLTAEGLDTRIVFIAYTDTMWAPDTVRIQNPKRFSLCFAPITRTYARTLRTPDMPKAVTVPYRRNQNQSNRPKDIDEHFAYLDEWKKVFDGSIIGFEYHSWSAHVVDINGLQLARRVNEDVKVYKDFSVDGLIQDGSQRHFFPHGMVVYSYARTMFDTAADYDALEEDYFRTAYGKDYKKYKDILDRMAKAIPYGYSSRTDMSRRPNGYYDPAMLSRIQSVQELVDEMRALIKENYTSPIRIQTVSVRLLEKYMDLVEAIARAFAHKCIGEDEAAYECYERIRAELGKWESGHERYYDHFHFMETLYHSFHLGARTTNAQKAASTSELMYADGTV
jgi:hypothetical protein